MTVTGVEKANGPGIPILSFDMGSQVWKIGVNCLGRCLAPGSHHQRTWLTQFGAQLPLWPLESFS
jgi:hypothetical protein